MDPSLYPAMPLWRRIGCRLDLVGPPARGPVRPFALVLRDARRLGPQFRADPAGRSFARYEGLRRSYDGVLAECCQALGIEHVLDTLAFSLERDFERMRVERLLEALGLGIGVSDAA